MGVLEAECAAGGKSVLFEKLRPSLLGDASYGDQVAVARELGLEHAGIEGGGTPPAS